MSTSGGVQYIGGYHEYIGRYSVHRRDTMSTSGMFSTSGRYHEYIGGCSVHRRDTMSTLRGYHEYIRGCSVHRGMFSTLGGSMSILGG